MTFQNGFEKIEQYVATDWPHCSNSCVLHFGNKQAGSDLCLNARSQMSALEEPTSEEHGKIPGDISSMNVT